MRKNKFEIILFVFLIVVVIATLIHVRPEVGNKDGLEYYHSFLYLDSGSQEDFYPNRLLTTPGAIILVFLFSKIFGSITFTWLLMNVLFYAFTCFLFYKIILEIQEDKKTALVSTMFFGTNYGLLAFGLNYIMDMGGWFFLVLSMFFTAKYAKFKDRKYILAASASVGAGLLFKEYTILGVVPIAFMLIYENFDLKNKLVSIFNIIKKSFVPAALAAVPILAWYLFMYLKFNYTYLDWINTNKEMYQNINRLILYIKCFGSLLNFLAVLFLFGLYEFWRKRNIIEKRAFIFIVSTMVSSLILFVWPGIAQRVLFVCVPSVAIISSFAVKKYIPHYVLLSLLFILYFATNFFMDSFVLNFVNLPF